MAQALADHSTSFVSNEWYVAALTTEIGRTFLVRQILGVGVLLYRREDGVPVAIRNRCPHRSYPLSRGRLEGDRVICGYHGLVFDPDGKCVDVPSQQTPPMDLCTPAYPLVERAPFVWIWMGDPALADPATVPDHSSLSDPGFAAITGYIHCRTNYIRLHENVLDLTHFPYVHGDIVGDVAGTKLPFTTERFGNSVKVTRVDAGRRSTGANSVIFSNEGHRIDRISEGWFKTPAFHITVATTKDLDGGVNGRTTFRNDIIHCFTPETDHSSHYFYGLSRDAAIDRADITEKIATIASTAFMQDEEVLEAVERTFIEEPFGYEERNVRADLPGLHMRRIIFERAKAERQAHDDRTGAEGGT